MLRSSHVRVKASEPFVCWKCSPKLHSRYPDGRQSNRVKTRSLKRSIISPRPPVHRNARHFSTEPIVSNCQLDIGTNLIELLRKVHLPRPSQMLPPRTTFRPLLAQISDSASENGSLRMDLHRIQALSSKALWDKELSSIITSWTAKML